MNLLSPLLDIRQLKASYGEAEVLHGIDLSVAQGEFVCIIGANTAGKSTILRSISRLVPKSSGIIRFGDGRSYETGVARNSGARHRPCSRGTSDLSRYDG